MRTGPLLKRVGYGIGIGAAALWGIGFATQLGAGAVKHIRIKRARTRREFCEICRGKGRTDCQLCLSAGYVDFTQQAMEVIPVVCACPLCKGAEVQKCPNCLGSGVDLTNVS